MHFTGYLPWVDIPAHYIRQGDSTYELWGVERNEFDKVGNFGREFVLKYLVNGRTYWDNNEGINYKLVPSDQAKGPGPMLGNGINVFLKHASISSDGHLNGYIDVRNIAYNKVVKLIYTTNNWLTATTLNANYLNTIQVGWSSFIRCPNEYNIERWGVTGLIGNVGTIKFFISYLVDGITYYDNNYRSDYAVGSGLSISAPFIYEIEMQKVESPDGPHPVKPASNKPKGVNARAIL